MDRTALLPTLERARAEMHHLPVGRVLHLFGGVDLLESSAVDVRRVAAVPVRARVLAREIVEHDIEVAAAKASALESTVPPLPEEWIERSVEVATRVSAPARCGRCSSNGAFRGDRMPSGWIRCVCCDGKGKLVQRVQSHQVQSLNETTCNDCRGSGVETCPTCDGSLQTVRARMKTIADGPRTFHHVYVPSLRVRLESALDARLGALEPPEPLRLPVDDSAYRGAEPLDSFEGFALEGRVGLARAALAQLSTGLEVVASDVHLYAWPILVLASKSAEAALFVDPNGKLEAVVDE